MQCSAATKTESVERVSRPSHHRPARGTVAYCKAHAHGYARRACIIRVVFARVGQSERAVQVAHCESRLDPRARNGQYLGIFQVSEYWRQSVPGWGMTVEQQARHALGVYKRVGRQWSPTWACA